MALLDAPGLPLTLELEVLTALSATEDERVFDRMLDRLLDRRPEIRAAAMAGAAQIDPDGFLLVVSSLGADRDWSVRAALATTLGTLDPDRVRSGLIEMTDDQDQRVRGPALAALARVGAPDLDARLRAALEVPDFVVRSTAARLLGERKTAEAVPALATAYERGKSDAAFDARTAALTALAAIGGSVATAVVRQALSDRDWPVRWQAAELLHGAGDLDAQPDRPANLRQPEEFFESAGLLHPPFTPVAYIETRLGTIEVALNVVDAPLTTRNFIELAHAGFFNGLRIHRLVPNFVAQTGDPRGDGEGGPGFAIGDELSPLTFRSGAVGIAKYWRDTGGSQFFITLSPQPTLDGRYTLFGQVVKGMDVVERLSIHDVIERVRIWDGTVLK
jgi:cyclophilin family peptidyl-prolyl cis-trans isomerase